MARCLRESGLLLFDLNTLLAYRTTFAGDSISRDGATFAWRGEASADSIRSAAREVIGLDRLLRGLEAG